jgi:hypothetical protein
MSARPVPLGTVACAACGSPVAPSIKGGEVKLSISTKAGSSMVLNRPICRGCAAKPALEVLRRASLRILAEGGE